MAEFLFATWDGGGLLPPELSVARALAARGHTVRMVADAVLGEEIRAAGIAHVPWATAPQRTDPSPRAAVARDWEARTAAGGLRAAIDGVWCGPAARYADDVRAEILRRRPDVVVSSGMLFGAQVAARAAGVPLATLHPNPVSAPGWGVPPLGPGWRPRGGPFGRLRDAIGGAMVHRLFGHGLPALNAARAAYGLAPLRRTADQLTDVDRALILTGTAFEYPGFAPPAMVRVVGPRLDDPGWAGPVPPLEGEGPLVLVALSSTYMRQEALLGRVAAALGTLPVRGLITTGPAVDPAGISAPPNVTVVRAAPHAAVLPRAAAVVTHAGHGTVIKALAAGVPVVCIPMGRDQAENAARAVAAGAGVRLRPRAGTPAVARAVRRVLDDGRHRAAAARLGEALRREAAEDRAVVELEALARVPSRVAVA